MANKKEYSYRDIWKILEQNGWKRNHEDEWCEYHFYELTLLSREHEATVRVWVSEDDDGIEASGYYGIVAFEIADYEYPEFPFDLRLLKDMIYAMELAEDNLSDLGIPFDKDYEFKGKNAAKKNAEMSLSEKNSILIKLKPNGRHEKLPGNSISKHFRSESLE